MIDVTKLFCGRDTTGDPIRYGHRRGPAHGNPHPTEGPAHAAPPSASDRRPVVAWNICRRCNLACVHCYTDSANRHYPGELTTEEGMALIDDLADFRIPALLFSGGEPLIRPDLFTLAAHARARNLRITLSTNGTLIDRPLAQRIAIREVFLRQELVDHRHRRAVGAVAFVEAAPEQQRDTHGLEIAWIDDVQVAVRTGRAWRSFATGDLVGRRPVLVAERQVAD
ncbi:MAG TPA: radical SAM protein, partial [Armatimonadota bacterium]|nr:radical SAM protein [Armatimonadota bacterium]